MKKTLMLVATLFFAACGGATDQSSSTVSAKQTQAEASTGQPSGIDVTVTRNGKSLAAFQSAADMAGIGAQLEKDHLSVEIMSRDNKWVLLIEVPDAKAGAYRLTGMGEKGKAMVRLTGGDDAMMVRADSGELKLSEVSETYCSGSFTGKSTDATGNKYIYEGKFSKVRVIKQD
jgi:phosphate-selective porin